nr:replication factor A protein 1-like [Ipomoea batatas]
MDEHVDFVLPYYNADLADPLIVILQLCRARVNDDGDVRISSSYTATKIMFNFCPEFFKFKERFLTPIRSISSRSRISGFGTMEALSSENITLTSLKDIYDNKKVGEFWVLGEILGIEGEWYFNVCTNKGCAKKLQDCTDKMYCKACDKYSPDGIIKYKVKIVVLDDDQDDPLLLWDNVCSTLLGVTASELKEKYSKVGCKPNEIEDLIGKTMTFRIVTRNDQFKYSGDVVFTVLGVKKDEAIAQTHQPKLLNKRGAFASGGHGVKESRQSREGGRKLN